MYKILFVPLSDLKLYMTIEQISDLLDEKLKTHL